MIIRPQLATLQERMQEPRRFIQVLSGPRQIGKTTTLQYLTQQLTSPWLVVSADDAVQGSNQWLQQQWDTARLQLKNSEASGFVLIIDEVQKIGNWSNEIKRLWDEDTKNKISIKLIITGSARLLLMQGLTESLAGRFELIPMLHWSFKEMQEAFDISAEQYAWFGGYPGAAAFIKNEKRWRDYIINSLAETTVSKDILMLTRIDKPALLKQVFELSCHYSGQIISYNKMIGQLQDAGNTVTAAKYLQLLDEAGLVGGIEKYSGSAIRQKGSSPKLQVYNTALYAAYSGKTFKEVSANPALWGRVVENAIGAHLLNQARLEEEYSIKYWRDGNEEVDFVIEKATENMALEVKSGAPKALKGLDTFTKKYQPKKVLITGNSGIAWQQFLNIDLPTLWA